MIPADQAGQCGKNQHEKCHIICKSILRKIKQTYGNTHDNTGQQKIKAGDNRQGVLVFEVDQEINLSDVSLVAVRDDKQAEIAIK